MLFFLCLFWGEFISSSARSWALFPLPCTTRNWEDGQSSNSMNSYKNIPVSDLVSFIFFWMCSLLPPVVVGSLVFPARYQSLEVKVPFSHLATFHFPSPNTPTTPKLLLMLPLVPMSTRPLFTGKLRSFAKNCCCTIWQSVNFLVAWMFVRKQKLGGQNPNHLHVIL